MEKIRIYRHPYAFDLDVTFGSFDEMIRNAKRCEDWDGYQIHLGGSFNRKIEEIGGRRASYLEIGVSLDVIGKVSEENVVSAKTICFSHWDGVYWYSEYFDEYMKKGLYPVSADWNGKTYIKEWTYKGKDKHGIPIADKPYYVENDGFVY